MGRTFSPHTSAIYGGRGRRPRPIGPGSSGYTPYTRAREVQEPPALAPHNRDYARRRSLLDCWRSTQAASAPVASVCDERTLHCLALVWPGTYRHLFAVSGVDLAFMRAHGPSLRGLILHNPRTTEGSR
jgi:hypothetical protein